MRRQVLWAGLAAAIIAAALPCRLAQLSIRPLHQDEAVNSIKLRDFLESGIFPYRPSEYHGPLLYYITLAQTKLIGASGIEDMSEATLRFGPALAGVLLLLLTIALGRGMGARAATFAVLLMAFSPLMVYLSRYFIHEVYLILFTQCAFVCGLRYCYTKKPTWLILTGVSLALMHTLKETCIIAFFCMALALVVTQRSAILALPRIILAFALTISLAVSTLFYSCFFQYQQGVVDSFRAFFIYAIGIDRPLIHDHAWWYYYKILGFTHYHGRPVWSEALILILALVGIVSIVRKWKSDEQGGFKRFLVVYTLSMLLIYTCISYKTPWSMLGIVHGLCLLAGVGASELFSISRKKTVNAVIAAALLLGVGNLAWQAYQLNFKYYASNYHPYVYAHTVRDCVKMCALMDDIALLSPNSKNTPVFVISTEYWPLPWYLRQYENVGYWSSSQDVELGEKPEMLVVSIAEAEKLNAQLADAYHAEYFGLRPDVKLLLYVRGDLWDTFLETRR
jgi:uncharacterized protein (TIGR03663 family)